MNDPLVCVAVTGRTTEELRRARDAAEGADIVELRLDTVERPDPAGALEGRRLPVIATCRAEWEGGFFRGSEEERRTVLERAIAAGAEFVDVEARAAFLPEIVRARGGRGVIVSAHDFDGVPLELSGCFRAMRATGAEVVKIAVTAHRLADVLPLLQIAAEPESAGRSHVLLAMGPAGVATRILAAPLHNRWTYAGDGVAPGQLPAARLLSDFTFRRLRPDAALYGIAGNNVGHSRSPAMHNAGFAALGMNAAYVPLQTPDAEDFVRFARAVNLRGASITAPHKVAMLRHMDDIDPVARRVGAVNTLIVRNGRWIGANTDVAGFLAPLAGRIALNGARASVLGAGGAARGVAIALADEGARVTICARRPDRARAIADLVGGSVAPFPAPPGTWDLLVNATPAGTGPDGANPMEGVALDGALVYDLVYTPAETRLMAAARTAGCDAIGGMEMLVAQAERQFELWTGQRPPAGLFARAAEPHVVHAPSPAPPRFGAAKL
jgi:3-dehydroquinate dehydratase / shikimate dehydrogenase